MTSFQAQIGWKMQRKRENKTVIPFRSVPTLRVIENSKKQQKNSKIPLWLHFMPKYVVKCREREKIKYYRGIMASFQAKTG